MQFFPEFSELTFANILSIRWGTGRAKITEVPIIGTFFGFLIKTNAFVKTSPGFPGKSLRLISLHRSSLSTSGSVTREWN